MIIVALMVGAFLGGFIPSYMENRKLKAEIEERQDQLAEAQERLQVALLQAKLGMMLIEVEQNNYGKAKERSTEFFDDLRQTATAVRDDRRREVLMAVLARRDEITSDLTSLNPETATKLRALFVQLYSGIGH